MPAWRTKEESPATKGEKKETKSDDESDDDVVNDRDEADDADVRDIRYRLEQLKLQKDEAMRLGE